MNNLKELYDNLELALVKLKPYIGHLSDCSYDLGWSADALSDYCDCYPTGRKTPAFRPGI